MNIAWKRLKKNCEKFREKGRQEGEQKAREESAGNLLSIGVLTKKSK